MDRQLKCRGKTWGAIHPAEGEWVYGQPLILMEEHYELGIYDGIRTSWDDNEDIAPESFGIFTGLKDKNGKEVYTGDMLKHSSLRINQIGEVVFFDGTYRCKATFMLTLSPSVMPLFEVVGNKYDNSLQPMPTHYKSI